MYPISGFVANGRLVLMYAGLQPNKSFNVTVEEEEAIGWYTNTYTVTEDMVMMGIIMQFVKAFASGDIFKITTSAGYTAYYYQTGTSAAGAVYGAMNFFVAAGDTLTFSYYNAAINPIHYIGTYTVQYVGSS